MHSTIGKEKREKMHIDALMKTLSVLNRERVSAKEKNFLIQRMRMEDQRIMDQVQTNTQELQKLKDLKQKMAEKVIDPILQSKGIHFNAREVTPKKFAEENYPKLMEHGRFHPRYEEKCDDHRKQELEKSRPSTPKKQFSLITREDGYVRYKDRVPIEARDHRLARTPNHRPQKVYTDDWANHTPTSMIPQTSAKKARSKSGMKELDPNTRYLQPLKKSSLVKNPQTEEEQSPIKLSKSAKKRPSVSPIAKSKQLHDELFEKRALQSQLVSDYNRGLFQPKINERKVHHRELKSALDNFDRQFLRMENDQLELDMPGRIHSVEVPEPKWPVVNRIRNEGAYR